MTLNTNPDPRLAPCTPTHSCLERIPTAQVSALFYPNQALDKRQLISRLTSLHQHRNRFMHHRTLTPSPNLIQYP
jgi:hypothetical protein